MTFILRHFEYFLYKTHKMVLTIENASCLCIYRYVHKHQLYILYLVYRKIIQHAIHVCTHHPFFYIREREVKKKKTTKKTMPTINIKHYAATQYSCSKCRSRIELIASAH